MKNKKWVPTLLIVCIVLVIITVIIDAMFHYRKSEQPLTIKEIPEAYSVSLDDSYHQAAFLQLYESKSLTSTPKDSLSFTTSQFDSSYSSCSGSLNFPTSQFFSWNFQTHCDESADNMTTTFIESQNTYILLYKSVEKGFLVLTQNELENDLGIFLLNSQGMIIWEQHLQDSLEKATITAFDILEVESGYYILGYADEVAQGDFQDIAGSTAFSFLAYYDLNGNLLRLQNLHSLSKENIGTVYEIWKYVDQTLYLAGNYQLLRLNGNDLDVFSLPNSNLYIMAMNDDYYYTFQDEEVTEKEQVSNSSTISAYQKDGTLLWNKKLSDLIVCDHRSCNVDQMISVGDDILVRSNQLIFFFKKDGTLFKTLDYASVKMQNETVSPSIQNILLLPHSYIIISFPDANHLYFEEYDFQHNLIFEKNYETLELYSLLSYSEDVNYFYQDQVLYLNCLFLNPDVMINVRLS